MTHGLTCAVQSAAAALAAPQSAGGDRVETTWDHTWPWPPWATLLALLIVAGGVLAAYLCERSDTRRRLRVTLAAIRVSLLGLLLFMMYGWVLHRHRTDLPDLIVALDDSQSMRVEDRYASARLQDRADQRVRRVGLDKASRLNIAKSLLADEQRGWLRRLSESYRVKFYLVGRSARQQPGDADRLEALLPEVEADESSSRLGDGLSAMLQSQRGRPTAAVVLLTDGATTAGRTVSDAAEYARRKAVPLFLVGLGAEQPPRDVWLGDLLTDDVVFVDDVVSFDFKIHHSGFAERKVVARLRRSDRSAPLVEQTIALPADGAAAAARLIDRPQGEGDVEYVVEVEPLEGEADLDNNRLARRISVRDATLRVLLVQSQPSYEFRQLKNLLGRAVHRGGDEARRAIELTTVLQEADLEHADQDPTSQTGFPVTRDELFAYDVLVFGDVNPAFLGESVMTNIAAFVKEHGGGMIFCSGPQFTPLAYRDTPLADLLPVRVETAAAPPPQAVLDQEHPVLPTPLGLTSPHMQLGDSPEATARIWSQLRGIRWLLEAPDVKPAARTLAVAAQRTSPDGQPLPVIVMQFAGAGKVVFHATDETYLWSGHGGGNQQYARYWLQTIRYLSRSKLLDDQQSAQIVSDRDEYRQGDAVRLTVRFVDERLAPAADDGTTVVLQRDGAQRRTVQLHRDALKRGEFSTELKELPAGDYRVWLSAPSLQQAPAPRRFRIRPPAGEAARLQMDAVDLRRAAQVSLGRFYTLGNAHRLPADLPPGRHVRVESLPGQPIWNSSWLAAAFVLLITTEWILRKKAGML